MLKDTAEIIKEKKVEYIELIYDLIFVYMIGKNSSLIHHIEDGFIAPRAFLIFVLGTLVIIQIWNITTFYINRYGSNGVQDHIMIMINMFLLYFMGDATRAEWTEGAYYKYDIAWALILINMLVNYWLKYRKYSVNKPWEAIQILYSMVMLAGETVIVSVSIPLYVKTGVIIAPAALAFGIIFTLATNKVNNLVPVDFGHLTERAMLFVVFTFGEMIVAIAVYFEGGITASGIYFELMTFLIVVGLFQSYELCYDYLIDRELITNGVGYMMIHIFLIFSLSTITAALEFMRESEVDIFPKTVFLTVSLIMYFVFLLLLGIYMKNRTKPNLVFIAKIAVMLAAFAVIMLIFRNNMYVNVAATVALVYGMLAIFIRAKKAFLKLERQTLSCMPKA
ncbi:MAG: low temperature requirement protein A [Firmicutes bacterium]|nr:low temperature requirement protein A [Bacillota bacterium]